MFRKMPMISYLASVLSLIKIFIWIIHDHFYSLYSILLNVNTILNELIMFVFISNIPVE